MGRLVALAARQPDDERTQQILDIMARHLPGTTILTLDHETLVAADRHAVLAALEAAGEQLDLAWDDYIDCRPG
jgi:hypothetical protein